MKRYEDLDEAMCRELEMLDKKYGADSAEMTIQDLEKVDKLYHALKSAETYYAMVEAGYDEEEERSYGRGRSYARRRDGMGRFSRDMGYSGRYPMYPMRPEYPMSYDDGGYRY